MTQRRARIAGQLGKFAKQYARKAQRGKEPNDRHYDREVEELAKRMDPEELSELLYGDSGSRQDDE